MVLGNTWAVNMDPKNWNDPHKFMPERFLDENGELKPRPAYFMPFSMGKRKCIGEVLAKNQLFLATAMIFQRFRFTPPPREKLTCDMNDFGMGCIADEFYVMAQTR